MKEKAPRSGGEPPAQAPPPAEKAATAAQPAPASSGPSPAPPPRPGGPTKETVLEALRPVHDPELMISIVDLGLIYDVVVGPGGRKLDIDMTLTSPGCPIGPELMAAVDHTARLVPGVEDVSVRLVWDPPWDPTKMASDAAKEQLGIW